jgi:hypothetical protein
LLEGEQAKTADLFAEDGRAYNLVGRDQIREHFGGIEKVDNNVNVNLCNNLVIDIVDEDHATATHYCTHIVIRRSSYSNIGQANLKATAHFTGTSVSMHLSR